MAHKYPNILIHYVFSTKERKHLIPDALIPRLDQIFRWHRTKLWNPRTCCGRNFQPFPSAHRFTDKHSGSQSNSSLKSQLFPLATRSRHRFRLARRIRRVQRKQLESRRRDTLHRTSGRTSSEANIRTRIRSPSAEIRNGIRSEGSVRVEEGSIRLEERSVRLGKSSAEGTECESPARLFLAGSAVPYLRLGHSTAGLRTRSATPSFAAESF